MAEDIRAKGFYAIAIDLFNGSVATNRDEAKTQTKAVKASEANANSLQKLNVLLLGHFGTFTTSAPEIDFCLLQLRLALVTLKK